jgi:hypothetical protein
MCSQVCKCFWVLAKRWKYDRHGAREDGAWLGEMTGLSELYTDTLLVLDCIIDRDLELMAHIHTGHDPSFEVIAAKYSHPDTRPGALLRNLATVLEDALSSNKHLQRRASFTTFTLNQSLSKVVEPSNLQGVLLWTNGIANDLENRIVIEGSKSPLFETGEYQDLGSCHFLQLFKNAELLYKSETTEVSKVSMQPGTHQFGKGDAAVSVTELPVIPGTDRISAIAYVCYKTTPSTVSVASIRYGETLCGGAASTPIHIFLEAWTHSRVFRCL